MKILLFACLLLVNSCSPEQTFKKLPLGPINHHLIVLMKDKIGVTARGFSGATPMNTDIFCEVGQAQGKITSKADGSFLLHLTDADPSIAKGEFTFTVDKTHYQQGYDIRDPSSLREIGKEAFETDKEVDAVSFFDEQVAILSSRANLLRTFSVDKYFSLGKEPNTTVLIDKQTLFPSWIVSVGEYFAVNLNLSNEIAIVLKTANAVKHRTLVTDDSGQPFRFALTPPLTIKNPIDANMSNTTSTTISESIARNPEYMIALDENNFLASFSNYYQFEDESKHQQSVVGPGVLAIMTIDNGALKTSSRLLLPYKNPRSLLRKDNEEVFVICGGAYRHIGKSSLMSDDAGLLRIKIAADFKSMTIEQQIPFTNFIPALPALVQGKLIIPHENQNEIAVIDETATTITADAIKAASSYRKFGFAKHWHDDIVFLGDNGGEIIAYSLSEGYFPFPFIYPIAIDSQVDHRVNSPALMIYFRHQEKKLDIKTHQQGYSAWILSANYKITPMDFLEVFGP